MKYLVSNFKKTWSFMSESKAFYLDVLLMHGFIMFFFTPFLVSMTQFILRQGGIPYISYDNLGVIMSQHPFVFLGLICIVRPVNVLVILFIPFLANSLNDLGLKLKSLFVNYWRYILLGIVLFVAILGVQFYISYLQQKWIHLRLLFQFLFQNLIEQ